MNLDLEKYLYFNVKTLRDTLIFNYPIYSDYKKVLSYTDLPYNFDQIKKPWWRWYYYASGSYYSRIHVNYSLWYNNHFKKKIGVYMPIVLKMPHKREKRYKPWIKKYFIYENSYKKKIENWVNPKNILNLTYNFFNYNYYKSNVITNYAHWKYNKILRSFKSSFYVGSENELFISGYNNKWNSLLSRDSLYNEFLINFNYTIPVNYFMMWGSFFINSYDSSIILHPHSYLNYYEKLNINRVNIIKKTETYFDKVSTILFYCNMINQYKNIFLKNIFMRLNIYYNKIIKNFTNIINKIILLNSFKNKKTFLFLNEYSLRNIFLFLKTKKYFLKNKIKDKIKKILIKIYKKDNYKFSNKIIWLNNFIKTKIYKKILSFNIKSGLKINKTDFIYYKDNITKSLIKLIRLEKKKKYEIYINFFKNLYKILNKKNIKYKRIFKIKKENLIYKLKIKRFNTYPKTFIKMIDKYRYLFNRITAVRNKSLESNTFLWSKFLENYINYVDNFLYNFFFIFIDLYKINFGCFYNLNTFNKENLDLIDMGFFLDIQIYIYKFFDLFKKRYLNNFKIKFINEDYIKYNKFISKISKNIKGLKKIKEKI